METTYDCAIEDIVKSIYSTMLNMELTRDEGSLDSEGDWLLSSVQIAGQWSGAVVLSFSPEIARESAVAMLQVASPEVSEADRNDVAAELANMVGGNLKSILPGPSVLSLPTIAEGRESGLRIHNAEVIDDVALRSEGGFLRVRLYAKAQAQTR